MIVCIQGNNYRYGSGIFLWCSILKLDLDSIILLHMKYHILNFLLFQLFKSLIMYTICICIWCRKFISTDIMKMIATKQC